jgi:Protein of unknown function (DUF2796)
MKCTNNSIWVLGFFLSAFFFGVGTAAEKRHHDVHAHGVAEVDIVVEGAKVTVQFRAPAESVMGFEHEAKSENDRKKRDAALEQLRTKLNQMIVFEPTLACTFFDVKTVVVEEKSSRPQEQSGKGKSQKKSAEHREVHAAASVACDKSIAGSRVRFGVYKAFPEIHEIKVQVLGDSGQSGATIKKDKGEIKL